MIYFLQFVMILQGAAIGVTLGNGHYGIAFSNAMCLAQVAYILWWNSIP